MLYIYIESNQIKVLNLKRTLLGQQEVSFFEKRHEVNLLSNGKVANVDVLASALKEAVSHANALAEKEVFLILPQESFYFMKADIPADIATSAVSSFINDKARSSLAVDVDNCYANFFVRENDKQKQVSYYAIEMDAVEKFAETLNLLGLKLVSLLPDTLAIFKLFEKTLRREKKENIFYVSFGQQELEGYLYDSGGLYSAEKWKYRLNPEESLEQALKAKADEFAEKGTKLNRVILSGPSSEGVRQDTFTKAVGAWTNPLKRIIPNFYEEYLKTLVVPTGISFPILSLDVCFGAFVFAQENKDFQMLKKPVKVKSSGGGFSFPRIPIFRKEVLIFLLTFALSFGAFVGLSKVNFGGFSLPKIENPLSFAKPTPTQAPTATPTPAPAFEKETIRVKVLNGSGTAGRASEVKDLLSQAGYEEILTGNADNFDYETTVFQIKKVYKNLDKELVKDLDNAVETPKVETLDDEETSDVIIIIGSDFQ